MFQRCNVMSQMQVELHSYICRAPTKLMQHPILMPVIISFSYFMRLPGTLHPRSSLIHFTCVEVPHLNLSRRWGGGANPMQAKRIKLDLSKPRTIRPLQTVHHPNVIFGSKFVLLILISYHHQSSLRITYRESE